MCLIDVIVPYLYLFINDKANIALRIIYFKKKIIFDPGISTTEHPFNNITTIRFN